MYSVEDTGVLGEILRLPIERAFSPNGDQEWAIKSNETPLDVLRRIPGFREVNQPVPVGEVCR